MAKTTSQIIAENKEKRAEAAAIAASRNAIHNQQMAEIAPYSAAKTASVLSGAGLSNIAPVLSDYYAPVFTTAMNDIGPVLTTVTDRMTVKGPLAGNIQQGSGNIIQKILGINDDTASLKDLTWNSMKRGYYNSLYGEESFKAMNGGQNQKDIIGKILSGEEYQFTPGNDVAEAVSGAMELLGQQARQYTHPRTLAAAGAAGIGAFALGQAGPQVLVPEEVITVPGAMTAAFTAGSAATNLEIEAGHAYNEMIEAGISEETARKVAWTVGIGNAGLEMIQLDELVDAYKVTKASGATKTFTKKLFDELVDRGVDVAKETAQEVVQEGVTIAGTQAASKLDKGEYAYNADEVKGRLKDTAKSSALSFGLMNVPAAVKNTAAIVSEQKNSNSLTRNEQAVVAKEVEKRVAEKEMDGKKLSAKEKNEIQKAVIRDMETGAISTDTIEEVLGGETYKSYKDTVDSEEAIFKEHAELGAKENATPEDHARYTELTEQIKNIHQNSKRDTLKKQLASDVSEMVKGDRLNESYNEKTRKSQKFEADLSQYDEKQRAIVQKAIDSGVMNNTNRSHQFVDLVAKIAADKGVDFDFASNAKIKESGFAVEDASVNGYVTENGVTINMESAKALNTVVGHEITHVLEGTEMYDALQKAVFDYAESVGELGSRWSNIKKLYKDADNTKINQELAADLVGDYLFTDSDFINSLYSGNRNIFEKIYDEVKYLCKVVTAGSKEARQLEKVKKAFADAYRVEVKNTTTEIAPVTKSTKNAPKSNNIGPVAVKNKKQGFWSKLVNKTVDKGMVFEDVSLKSGNMELQAKWDYSLPSKVEARAQYFMRNGKNGSPSLDSVRKQIERTGKTEAFQEYMWHWRNVDGMTLSERFGVDDKPVFGESVTAEISRKKIEQYEKENPEFKKFADDLYANETQKRRMMVESGLITEEQAAHMEEMYPHYIPLSREMDEALGPVQGDDLGVNSPIKSATGGNRPLQPMFDTIAQQTIQTFKAAARNDFGVELKNTIQTSSKADSTSAEEIFDSIDNQSNLLGASNDGYTFSVYENGQKVTFGITEAMHDALKPTEGILAKRIKPLTTVSNLRRNLITTWNPVFALYRNPAKDLQDVMINSQHPVRTYTSVPLAIKELLTGGKWATEYLENGGEQNTYYDNRKNEFAKEDSGIKKLIGMPFRGLESAGEFIERIPRVAEYIASRKEGRSIQRSMLDSARVTTNFAAGGDFTKFLNSHGFTFLNAGVQGFSQNVRNFREAKMNGLKGWVQLAAKFTVAGLSAEVLNGLCWDEEEDEEYEALSDHVKQNYYVVAKTQDGKFVRIPKGRVAAVIQDAMEQMEHLVTGDDEADFESFFKLFMDNVAPNNPLDNNIIAPINQALANKTWYDDNLVPARLKDLPAAEQYDESTDSISKWLGEKMDISPYKINYLLDQYSGGLGDAVLPMLTPEAESNNDSLLGYAIAPWKKEFTADSVLNNRVTGDFYDVLEAAEAQAESENASAEDRLKSQFLITNNVEISKLMQKQREIQSMDLSDADKYEYSRELKKAINTKMEEALAASEDMKINGKYAEVGDRRYNYDEGKQRWYEIKPSTSDGTVNWYYQKEQNITKTFGVSYEDYWNNKTAYDDLWYLANAYDSSHVDGDSFVETYKALGADKLVKYASGLAAIKADKDEYGNSIRGSRKKKVKAYIYGLNLPDIKKDILYKTQYGYDVRNNREIVEYLRTRPDISADDMRKIIEELGGKMDKNGNVTW